MKKTLYKNGKIYTPDRVIENGWILVDEEGKIVEIGEGNSGIFNQIKVINLNNSLVLPGFIDIHVHGGNGHSVMDGTYDALNRMSIFHAQHGTTSFLATTTTSSYEKIQNALSNASETMKKGLSGAEIIGIHLEGPFINERRSGAQDKVGIKVPSLEMMKEFINTSENHIKIVTLAPELDSNFKVVEFLSQLGITVSIGHSNATFEQVENAVEKGCTHTTHHFNGMSPLHHREPGVAGAGLIIPELTTEIITDGIHVHPAVIKLLFEVKGVENICMITDAVFCAGLPDATYENVVVTNGEVYLKDGSSLAGSSLTMIQALKNVLKFTGYSIENLLPALTLVPAREARIDDSKGSLERGKDADFIILDDTLTILSTVVKGQEVYKSINSSNKISI